MYIEVFVRVSDNVKLAQLVRVGDCLSWVRWFDSGKNSEKSETEFQGFDRIKLRAKPLGYFLRSNKSNINQSLLKK